MRSSRSAAAVTIALVLTLSACGVLTGTSDSTSESSLEDLASQTLSDVPGVASVEAHQSPVGEPSRDRADPDQWELDVDVRMADDVSPDLAADAADATETFIAENVGSVRWSARLRIGERTQVEVHPTVRTSAASDARDALAMQAIEGVVSIAVAGGEFTGQVASAETLASAIEQLRRASWWTEGGSVQAESGRVRVADVPARITASQIAAFSAASVSHPEADFAIESSGDNPEVYVNRVSDDQARAIVTAFTRPMLAHRDGDGFTLEFNIRATSADDTVDLHGTFGVPDGE